MNAALRPATLGEILDRTFRMHRERYWVFAGIAALPAALIAGMELADSYWWHAGERFAREGITPAGKFWWGLVMSLAFYHISIPVHAVFTSAILKQSSGLVLGEDVTLRSALGFALRRWLRFLWIGTMMLLTTLIGVEAVTVGVFWGLGTTMDAVGLMNRFNWFAVALLLGTLVAGFVLYLWVNGCFAFAAPACAFEDSRSFRAMGRSWGLSREGRWRVAGTLFLLLVFLLGLTVGTQRLVRIIFATIWDWTTHHAHLMAMRNGADYVVRAILSAVVSPLYPIAVTLIYYDQRIRKEGFDIEGLMQSAGMVEAVAAAADAAAGGETDA